MLTHLAEKSDNEKTGPMPVSTSDRKTCPPSCAFFLICYGARGPIRWHWDRVSNGTRGTDWEKFCQSIAALPDGEIWRHNQIGDLPGKGERINGKMLRQLVRANAGKRGFSYSHKRPEAGNNRKHIIFANTHGFTVNLSGNGPRHADKLADLKIAPVATVVPLGTPAVSYTPKGRKVVICPAQQRDDVTCSTCALCQKVNRSVIVGFLPHGTFAKQVNAVALANS